MREGWIHLHGLMVQSAPPAPGAPTHDLIPCGAFVAVTSTWEGGADVATFPAEEVAKRAMDHHRILLAHCTRGALLPMRFGTVFSTRHALRSALANREGLYRAALDLLAQARAYVMQVDFGLEVPPEVPTTVTGRGFLDQKRQARDLRQTQSQHRRAFAERLETEFCTLGAAPLMAERKATDALLDLTVLIADRNLTALKALAETRSAEANALGLTLGITGPWPAYGFDLDAFDAAEVCHGA